MVGVTIFCPLQWWVEGCNISYGLPISLFRHLCCAAYGCIAQAVVKEIGKFWGMGSLMAHGRCRRLKVVPS